MRKGGLVFSIKFLFTFYFKSRSDCFDLQVDMQTNACPFTAYPLYVFMNSLYDENYNL